MKRMVCLILSLSLSLSLCACGSGNAEADQGSASAPQDSSPVETDGNTVGSNGDAAEAGDNAGDSTGDDAGEDAGDGAGTGVEVDTGLFDVTITVPATYLGEGVTQEQLTEQAEEAGYKSITLNEDGSATYVMSKTRHKEMMDGMRQEFDETLKAMETSGAYPNFVSAAANGDYTQFIIEINADELAEEYAYMTLGLYLIAGSYHAFNGTQPENINIQFVSAETGEVLEEYNSRDAE